VTEEIVGSASLRIAVVANTGWYLFNFRLNLMRELAAAGHQVVAVAPEDAYAHQIRVAGVTFQPVEISGAGVNPLTELRSVGNLHAALKRHAVDLVLSYTPKGNLYSALACIGGGIPFIPNVSGLGRVFVRSTLLTRGVRALYRFTFNRAPKVFFQNEEDMAEFVRLGIVRAERAERLPGSGVDLSKFRPMPYAPRASDGPVFLLAARMLWDKGIGEYVTAARRIRATHPAATFQLLGSVPSESRSAVPLRQIDEWVREGVITYLGMTDDVRPHLAAADCAVLPSYYREGVPRVMLEAAATARPVITSDAVGCRDTVHDGVTGFLCKPADSEDLVAKMLDFMRLAPDARRTMGERARAFVEQHFDERFVLERYCQVVAERAHGEPTLKRIVAPKPADLTAGS
jgi:glycosyltransferase involved in cell wall biosynthesis